MSVKSRIRSNAIASERRDFLKLAAIAGGAVAMAGLASRNLEAEEEPDGVTASPTKKGYHVTAHIKDYYDKARF